jgi:hypothetical protein
MVCGVGHESFVAVETDHGNRARLCDQRARGRCGSFIGFYIASLLRLSTIDRAIYLRCGGSRSDPFELEDDKALTASTIYLCE